MLSTSESNALTVHKLQYGVYCLTIVMAFWHILCILSTTTNHKGERRPMFTNDIIYNKQYTVNEYINSI